jgi:hypothetical protein
VKLKNTTEIDEMIRTKPASPEYRDNYDKIFSKNKSQAKESDLKPSETSYPKGREKDGKDKSTTE